MSESELVERLADALAERLKPAIPLSVDLWDIEMIASFLKRHPQVVRKSIVCLSSFPKAIRLPTERRAHPLYKAKEVIEWAEKYKEKN